jgi:two-component system phosphate regulon sensor histidine kinase PhoR
MRRSLFLAIYLRTLVVMLLAFAPFYSVIFPAGSSNGVLWGAIFEVAVLAGALALAMAHFLRRATAPLQAMVEKIPNKALTLEEIELQPYSEFDDLAGTIAGVSTKAQGALMEASESKRELEALLDSMQDAVVAVDGDGRIQWANQRMRRLVSSVNSGGASVSAAAVASAVRVGHALVQTVRDPELLGCVKTALDKREICERKTTLLVPGRIFEVSASPMPAGGAVAVLHDITRIEEVEQTQRDFVANVSHELRTPLTSISGYVETLLDHEKLSPVAQEFLGTILKNASRMSRLTEDLLTMARVESHETELHPRRVRADALVKDAVETMRGLVQDDEAVVEIGETTAAEVFADVDSMVQVLGNLIENGIKYGQTKGSAQSRVVVSARVIAEPVECVEFSVRDFGAGISSVHLTRIFERFYRVDKARSRESGGTGLGLAIARHMVEMQGGTIRAESDLGAGSDFLVRLPRAQSVSE